jgi:hypothetical protein
MSRSDMRSLIVQCIPVLTQSSWSVMCTTPVIRIFQGLSLGFPHGRWGPCRRFFFFFFLSVSWSQYGIVILIVLLRNLVRKK